MDEVWDNLYNPVNLVKVKAYIARSKHDESYRIYFRINKRKKLVIGGYAQNFREKCTFLTA